MGLVSAYSGFAVADDNVHCHAALAHEPSAAEKAYLLGDASKAESLYREALTKSPHDPALVSALVRTLLREQKVDDASTTINSELASAPTSVVLLTALGEVQYRQGKSFEAASTADQGFRADPCNPRLHLLRARIMRLNSMYASERREVGFAHSLDPWDSEIRGIWISTLPLAQRIEEQKKFLASANGLDAEGRTRAEHYLAELISRASNPGKTCHLVSPTTSTQIPMVPVMNGARSTGEWGLDVFFNNKNARLDIDTGASGLFIDRAVAERAGLQAVSHIQIGGIGDQGLAAGYTAYADSVRIGSLEFHDCLIEVSDRKGVVNSDGLIGADVFSNYLVTLNYPGRKLSLSPLPPNPSERETATLLNTSTADQSSGSNVAATGFPIQPDGPPDRYVSPAMKDYSAVFRSGHMLLMPTVLNRKVQRLFLVDTGAFSSFISPEVAREVTKVHGGAPVSVSGLNGEVAKVSTGDKVILQFGGIEQENNDLLAFDTASISKSAGLEVSGLLGDTVLRQLTIHIDYRDGLIKFDYDPRHDTSGFTY
jgi:predicted aspartyl protease